MKSPPRCAVQSLSSDDATRIQRSIDRPDGTVPMMGIPLTIGVILILIGLVLFVVDFHTGHGLLTAGSIVTLLAGGLVLLWAGIPYAGVLLGAVVVVAVLMGLCSWGSWVRRGLSEGGRLSQERRG